MVPEFLRTSKDWGVGLVGRGVGEVHPDKAMNTRAMHVFFTTEQVYNTDCCRR